MERCDSFAIVASILFRILIFHPFYTVYSLSNRFNNLIIIIYTFSDISRPQLQQLPENLYPFPTIHFTDFETHRISAKQEKIVSCREHTITHWITRVQTREGSDGSVGRISRDKGRADRQEGSPERFI